MPVLYNFELIQRRKRFWLGSFYKRAYKRRKRPFGNELSRNDVLKDTEKEHKATLMKCFDLQFASKLMSCLFLIAVQCFVISIFFLYQFSFCSMSKGLKRCMSVNEKKNLH